MSQSPASNDRFSEGRGRTAAVIVAAGSSLRMGSGVQKQFLSVNGIPVLARTMQSFESCPEIGEIIVVAKAEELSLVDELVARYGIRKLTAVVAGGNTRAVSAGLGFERVSTDADFVAIHDGARCLVTSEEIASVCRAAYQYRAATAAMPVTDTVKYASADGMITETLDRRCVYLAATPQVFDVSLYRRALEAGNTEATDDNQLIEQLPHPVRIIPCNRSNIKITYPEDIALAEFLLKQREELR